MKLVPTVVLLEESYMDLLQQWSEDPDVQDIMEQMGELATRNGWTAEMLLGGLLLRDSMKREVSVTQSRG